MQFFYLFFLSHALLLAQQSGTIQGVVKVRGGSVLHDATVVLSPLTRTLHTGEDGAFTFTGVAPGRYELLAHLHGFTDERVMVNVTAGQTSQVTIELGFAPVRQEITVTASGREESVLETFSSVSTLDGNQLSLRNTAPSLGELIENEPGIAKRSFGPGSSRPVVRGFDGDRVLVLQDGTRSGTLSSQSGDHGEPVDGSTIERVEIVRGPGTLLYGTNAVGGVVNVITRHHELEQHPHAGIRGHLKGIGGTNNGLGGGSGGFELGAGSWLFWGSGGGQRTGDYSSPAGKVENSFANITQASAGFGHYNPRHFFTLSYNLQDGRYGVPAFEVEEHDEEEAEEGEEHSHAHENVAIDWRRHNVRFHGGFREMEGWLRSFRATVNYSDWRHHEVDAGEIATRFSNRQSTWQGLFEQGRRGILSGNFGVWAMHRSFRTRGAEALAPPVTQQSAAAFAVEELSFEKFRVQLGGRLEHNSYDPENRPARSFTGLSGSAGVHVPLWTGGAAVANFTSSYRAPALEELYNRGPHLGNLAYEIGNADLRRERANGVELSLRHSSARLRGEVSAYYNRISDFVFLAPTGAEEDGLIEAEYAQAGARYIGAEARLDAQVHPLFWLNLGFDVVDAQLRQTKTPLPRIPPVRGRVGFDFRRGGFNVRPELVLSNRQWQIFPTETPTAGYVTANLLASYTIAGPHFTHMFGVNVFNVNDKLYRNHLSFIKEVAPEIGRGVRFSYTMHFY